MTDESGAVAADRVDWLWFLGWALASSIWCVTAASQLSAVFDEPIYIVRGLEAWRSGSHGGLMQLGTMPLPIDVATLPLFIAERWRGAPFVPSSESTRLLPWARAATLVFWWLLLFYAWRAGRALAGAWAGRLSVALLACEPTMLAHASLATTDIAVTSCLLALVYHFRMARHLGWLRRVGVPTLWYAATVLAKASGLVYGPLCLLAVEVARVVGTGDGVGFKARLALLKPFGRDLGQIVGYGLVLVFLYCGSDWRTEPSFVAWAHDLPDGSLRASTLWLAEHLRIFSNAGEGLARQIKHSVRGAGGHWTYLLGESPPLVLVLLPASAHHQAEPAPAGAAGGDRHPAAAAADELGESCGRGAVAVQPCSARADRRAPRSATHRSGGRRPGGVSCSAV